MNIWTGVIRDFRRTWPQLLAADLLAKIVAFAILSPSVGLVLRLLLSASGNVAIKDEDLLFFFVRPLGLVTLLVVGGGMLAVAFLLQAALMTIGFAAGQDRCVSYIDSVRFAFNKMPALFRLAVRILARMLLTTLPAVIAMGIVYVALLGKHDINYYLAEKPPAFWAAAAIGGVIVTALLVLLARLVVGWAFALPILLFENTTPAQALSDSRSVTTGRRNSIAWQLGLWSLGWLVLSSASAALVLGMGRILVPAGSDSLTFVAVVVSALVVVAGLVNLTVSFFADAFLSLLIVRLYQQPGRSPALNAAVSVPSVPIGNRAPRRVPKKELLGGGLVASLLVTALSVVLAAGLEIEDRTTIAAHRGYSAVAPENTIAAVERAISAGSDWAEIDVQETADGIVVLFHDGDLKKVAGLDWRIGETAYADLKKINIGSRFSPEFADQQVATLGEVLDLCKGKINVIIELKYYGHERRLEERVVEIVESKGMQSDIALMSLKTECVQKLKMLRPSWPVGLLAAVSVGDLTKLNVDFLAVNTSLATGRFIRAAHRRGLAVHVWTVNDPITMSAMISRGVDNLITDQPAVARSVLEQRAKLSPVERLLVRVCAALGVLQTKDEPSSDSDA